MKYWITFGLILLILLAFSNWCEISITKSIGQDTITTAYGVSILSYEHKTVRIELRNVPLYQQLFSEQTYQPSSKGEA